MSAAVAVRVSGVVEGAAEEIDGVVLEAKSDVGVDGGGDADVGVAEEFLDHDEFDALFQEQGRGGVPEVVEADAAAAGLAEEPGEGPGEIGSGRSASASGACPIAASTSPPSSCIRRSMWPRSRRAACSELRPSRSSTAAETANDALPRPPAGAGAPWISEVTAHNRACGPPTESDPALRPSCWSRQGAIPRACGPKLP